MTTDNRDRVYEAAMAWASAERALRDKVNYAIMPTQGEERHILVLSADWHEQKLLEACEAPGRPDVTWADSHTSLTSFDEPSVTTTQIHPSRDVKVWTKRRKRRTRSRTK